MQPFTILTGLVAPLDRVNVDTDQIIPKQFLKTIERTGLREGLFLDWRKKQDGAPDPELFLNQPRYNGATILLTREWIPFAKTASSRASTRSGSVFSTNQPSRPMRASARPKPHGSFRTCSGSLIRATP